MLRISVNMVRHSLSPFLLTVLGIAVAFFLAAAMSGLLIGWCRTTSALIRHADADLWVVARRTPAFDFGTAIPRSRIHQARSVPGVAWAEGLFVGWNYWQTPDGQEINVALVGLDDGCVGGPWKMKQGSLEVLHLPSSVIVDELFLGQLGVRNLGDEVEVLSRRAVVRGICQEVRTFTASPYVFTSLESAIDYDQRYRHDEITYVLVKCAEGSDPLSVRQQAQAYLPDAEVLTSDEFAVRTTVYWMLKTGAGITVVITAILGLIVGTVIASQTMYTITQHHLKDYAVLLAVGFHRWQLALIAGLQALLLGAAGIGVGAAGFFVTARTTAQTPIPVETTAWFFAALCGFSLACCLAASLLSVRSIFKVDPVLVFHT